MTDEDVKNITETVKAQTEAIRVLNSLLRGHTQRINELEKQMVLRHAGFVSRLLPKK